jgi:hypothetical protein
MSSSPKRLGPTPTPGGSDVSGAGPTPSAARPGGLSSQGWFARLVSGLVGLVGGGRSGKRGGGPGERAYRSPMGIAAGVLVLVIVLGMGIDAIVGGSGRVPWLSAAGMLLAVPVVAAFTLRPAVFADRERISVRNPLRTITAGWAAVESVRAGYSAEMRAGGRTYQLWALPVSIRERRRARRTTGKLALSGDAHLRAAVAEAPIRSAADQAVADLAELAAAHPDEPDAPVTVRWAYEVLGPAAAGVLAFILLYVTR